MDTNQIAHALLSDNFTKTSFQGVFPSDTLRELQPNYPCSLVINLDPSHLPGSHWVAVFISKEGHGEYFDSYGLPPSTVSAISTFMNRVCIQHCYNEKTLQSLFSDVCGHYVIFYLLHKNRGCKMETIKSWFSSKPDVNDRMVYEFISKYFPCIAEGYRDVDVGTQTAVARGRRGF
ncbi:hypothetical protein HOLleu_01951 [Holothuria leucospilota]|uniref:Ubiquitin-like protease family profile domain-containing protein n=1 Tax=Holothuria leucospilota TaxID=206669 RepID=A0A9Q1CQ04_HOLLE|nr:hypothetical protein HOLleu_01951 [Holothuria leucospilota]